MSILQPHSPDPNQGSNPYWIIGGGGGTSFEKSRYNSGIVISGLETWAYTNRLRGIRITYSDGEKILIGKADDTNRGSITIDYANGERVTELSIWGNGEGTRCGAFRIRTNRGKDYFPKMTSSSLKTEYKMSVGGGLIMGMIGRANLDIDALGFLMIRPILYSRMIDMSYDLSSLTEPRLNKLLDVEIPNASSSDNSEGYRKLVQDEVKRGKWYIKGGFEYGMSFKATGSIPLIAEAELGASWKVSVEGGYESEWSNRVEETIQVPLIVPAKTKMRFIYGFHVGTIPTIPYRAKLQYTLNNDSVWTININGTYDGVDVTRISGDSIVTATWDDTTNQWIPNNKAYAKLRRFDVTLSSDKSLSVVNHDGDCSHQWMHSRL